MIKLLELSGSKLCYCKNIAELSEIEKTCENHRNERFDERNYLYNLFIENQQSIKILFQYTKFTQDNNLLIDFESWINNNIEYEIFLKSVKKIQPNIILE